MKKTIFIIAVFVMGIACGNSENLAKVNGKKISKQEYESYLNFKRLSAKDDARKDALLSQYLERFALADVIEKEKVLDEQKIQAELSEFKKEMLISRYFENYLKQNVTDDAVKNYYTNHTSEFENKKAHIAHILIRTNKAMSDNDRKAKKTKIQDLYSKIMAQGDFEKIAKAHSEDNVSSLKGGDLGWIKEGSIDSTFSKLAFELKKGDVSKPFETKLGYHIIKVLDEPKIIMQPFESVAGSIRYQLRAKAKKAEMDRLVKKTNIKRYE